MDIGDYKMWDVEAAEAYRERLGDEIEEARQERVGRGQPGSSPESEPVGISDMLPAELIDRAVDKALGEVNPNVKLRHVEQVIEAVAPLLVEHGATQEKTRWETRIEKQAAWEDRAKAERTQMAEMYERNGSTLAKGLRAASYRHRYTGHVLRSLLTEAGADQ